MRLTRHPARKLAAIYAGGVVGALMRVGLAEAFPAAAGAGARFVVDHEIAARVDGPFPLGILAVNLSGQGTLL